VIFALHNKIGLRPNVVDVALINEERLEDVVFAPDDLSLRY
jgi:hypothetical protein